MLERILIVGFGSIGKRHFEIARQLLPDVKFGTLRSGTGKVEANEGISFSSFDLQEALNFKPDIVVLANPASHHIKLAIEFAKHGIHLFIEKPISDSSLLYQEFSEIIEKSKVNVAVGYNLKFSPSLQFLKKQLETRTIGKVLSVECSVGQYLPDWRPEQDYRETVSAKKDLGGGVLLELSHELNYLAWLFGSVDSVVCISGKSSDLEINVEDSANLLMQIKQNSVISLVIQLRMDFIRRDPHRFCTILGEKGTLIWDYISGFVKLYDPDKKTWIEMFSQVPNRDETYIAEWKDFLFAIETGSEPLTSYKEGFQTLKVVEAARASNGNLVKVNY